MSMSIKKPTSGNRTERRGSRYIQRPVLDRDTAQEIKILMLAAGRAYTPESVASWLSTVVHALYRGYEAERDRDAEAEWNSTTL